MSVSVQRKFWEVFEDYLKAESEDITSGNTTEGAFFNSTQPLSNISTVDNYKETENVITLRPDLFNVPKVYNSTVYDAYPIGILWLGAGFLILFSILGTTGNLVSIAALVNSKRLRKVTTAFIVNLCVSDLSMCCFSMPFTALTFVERDWKHGDALCKFFSLVKFFNTLVSVFTIVVITVNRYILIVHPNVYPHVYTKWKTAIIIAALWIIPLIFISLPLFNVWGTLTYNPYVGDCGIYNLNGKSPRGLVYITCLIIPSIIFIACYLRIYIVVKNTIGSNRKHNANIKRETAKASGKNDRLQANTTSNCEGPSTVRVEMRDKKEFRVLQIVLAIFIVYMSSIFPVSFVKLFRKEAQLPLVNILVHIFFFLSNVVNPVVYVLMSREYRMAYKELFASKICCN